MERKNINKIEIAITGRKNIEYTYTVIAKEENDGGFSVWIPVFDIYFSVDSTEEIRSNSKELMNSFFNFWIADKGWNKFINKIQQIGFKASNEAQRKAIARGSTKINNAKLRASISTSSKEFNSSSPKVKSFSIGGKSKISFIK